MSQYKTPGIYLVEKNAFPNSVVEVATAIPVFIGYTEKADYKGQDLINKPFRITSFAEFNNIFGGAPEIMFNIADDGKSVTPATALSKRFRLYYSMRMFFQNGGSTCYILSVGKYKEGDKDGEIQKNTLMDAISLLEKEQEPTLVIVPDAVSLANASECADVQNEVLNHCKKMQNRFAILDVYDGFKELAEGPVDTFRDIITNNLNYGAAYYPWLNTSVVTADDVTFKAINKENIDKLVDAISKSGVSGDVMTWANKMKENSDDAEATVIHKALKAAAPKYSEVLELVRKELNLMAPAAAIAGIYAAVDNASGVWKAPANVGVNGVVTPAVNLTDYEQEDLNKPVNGKSVNAIRSFIGSGIKVWGARTLDGNSQEWCYVNVRRTLIMIEESLRQASKAYVFEPNTLNTWVTMKSMFNNFLTNVWKRGGLAGASPEDAFEVYVGLNETMTADDILNGVLRITVKVAVSRPAEFIEITFQQQQQKS
jgi:hypothetical protein